MNIKKYVEYRQILDKIDINKIEKKKYQEIKGDYNILIKLAEDYKEKDKLNNEHYEIHWEDYISWFFVGFGIMIGLFSQMGYATTDSKEINIGAYLFLVVTAPIIIFTIAIILKYIQKKDKKENIYCFKKLFDLMPKLGLKGYVADVAKKSACYYIQITSIVYSISSTILLLYHTGIKNYNFIWDSTWIGSSIIKIYSIPVGFINSSFIPNELSYEATKTLQGENSENWLWFLILIAIVWIIIPRVILSIFYHFKLRRNLKESFITNSRSEIILKNIKKTYDFKFVENTKKEIKIEQNSDLRKNIIFWQLTQTQEKYLNDTNFFSNQHIISLEKVKDFNNYKLTDNQEIIILINSVAPPQYTIINLLNKLTHYSYEYKFIDSDGFFIENKTDSVNEWLRFIKENK
ncbi:DUF2868 domain-containing protein [Aliarcobacter cryaerophilus]|uniref:DUF2868 domain-containing protein n=1 Tax=Aliarcobacter cryaerophilus TaxID=28198 RepID=UPI0021B65E05|nr:DUF2868 domain-containing protein [Aliarcobacter cryaerophilus]MCT7485905.1 DUF2868 domain-containing protein [Aliarcobacter cryaerophilus]MCT7489937.1 DUF2868 domain-containing protein [Aliarcobacter cryaerophilus]